jgi:outer membrane cobalamin receptor
MKRLLLFLIIVGLSIPLRAMQEPGSLTGRVVSEGTRESIPSANVYFRGVHIGASTNAEGYYSIGHIPPGTYSIIVSAIGYTTIYDEISIEAGERKTITFSLRPTVYHLNQVTVTATRERSLISEVPATVDIISARDLRVNNVQNIGEALQRVPGVSIRNYGGFGDMKTISIRGSSSGQVLILLDGQRLNNAQSGEVDLSTIPLEGVERIEVVRGSASAIYGADAVGGVINIITKSGSVEDTRIIESGGSLLGGSFGSYGVSLNGSYTGNKVFTIASYKHLASDGNYEYSQQDGTPAKRENADYLSHEFFGKGTWKISEGLMSKSLSLSGTLFKSEAGNPGTTFQPNNSARKKNENQSFNVVYNQKLFNQFNSIRVQGYLHNGKFWYKDPDSYVPSDTYSNNTAGGGEVQSRTVFSTWNVLTAGYSYRYEDFTGTALETKPSRTTHSIYVQDELERQFAHGQLVKKIVAIPSIRWDDFSDFGAQWSPKFGLVLSSDYLTQLSIKGTVGKSFRAPTFNDLYWPQDSFTIGNPDLQPESATDFDIGLMMQDSRYGELALGLTYFTNDVEDLIIWQIGTSGLWSPFNIGKALIRGIEASASFNIWKDIARVSWNYTYLDPRNKSPRLNEYNKLLPYRPRHSNNVSLHLTGYGFHGIVNVTHMGERYITTANTVSLPSHEVIDCIVSYRIPLHFAAINATFEMKNIAGREYQVMDGFPMPGREVRFTVDVAFRHAFSSANQQH